MTDDLESCDISDLRQAGVQFALVRLCSWSEIATATCTERRIPRRAILPKPNPRDNDVEQLL